MLGVAVMACAAVGACSGGGSGGVGTTTVHGTPIAWGDLASELARQECNALGNCCRAAGYGYDAAACEALLIQQFKGIPSPNDPSVAYDSQAAGDCVATIVAGLSSCRETDGSPDVCDRVFNGRLPAGASCSSDEQCAGSSNDGADCSEGTCIVMPRGHLGDACGSTCTELGGGSRSCTSSTSTGGTARCFRNDGLYCDGGGHCASLLADGAACSYDECALTSFCDAGTCAAKRGLDQACSSSDSCAVGFCDEATSVCTPPRGLSQPCNYDSECASDSCGGDGVCTDGGSFVTPTLCSGVP